MKVGYKSNIWWMLSYVQFYVAMTADVQAQQCSSVAFIEFESMEYDFISDEKHSLSNYIMI